MKPTVFKFKLKSSILITMFPLLCKLLTMPLRPLIDFNDVRKWLSANKLKLNPDKTEFILFGSRNGAHNLLGNLLSPV